MIENAARARWIIPTDKSLAERTGMSINYVKKLMRELRRQLVPISVVSNETTLNNNAATSPGEFDERHAR